MKRAPLLAGGSARGSRRLRLFVFAAFLAMTGLTLERSFAQIPQVLAFDGFINSGSKALNDGKIDDGMIAALAAIKQNDQRFEGYALVALLLENQGKTSEALNYVEKALARAPESKKAQLEKIKERFSQLSATPVSQQGQAPSPALSGEARRKSEALMLIVEDADKAKTPEDRKKLLSEFMDKSDDFLTLNEKATNIWLTRAAVAVELDAPADGWKAGRKLIELGGENSGEPKLAKLLATLERKGWLEMDPPFSAIPADLRTTYKGAKANDADDQHKLGESFLLGTGIRDPVQAVRWFRKAADQGHLEATFSLARLYEDGRGVERNVTEMERLYIYAAEQGHVRSMYFLGYLYQFDDGRRDFSKAVHWFRQAAERNDSSAQMRIGYLYEDGLGTPRNEAEAAKWYLRAAQNKYSPTAYLPLWAMYKSGRGVNKNQDEAAKWYSKAQESNGYMHWALFAGRLAASPNEKLRNGKLAIELAQKALELSAKDTNPKGSRILAVERLAWAYAEMGNFEEATKRMEEVTALSEDRDGSARKVLKLFQARTPYRLNFGIRP
jgi:TPR repeat protein